MWVCVEDYKNTIFPWRKIMDVEEVADLVAFLASDKVIRITGETYAMGKGCRLGSSSIDFTSFIK